MSAFTHAGASHYQGLGLTVFEDVVPQSALAQMNASIDANRAEWPSADGGNLPLASSFGDVLRRTERFRRMESQACADSRDWAVAAGLTFSEEAEYSLRCVNQEIHRQSHLRHHDSHLLTLLVPLQLAHGPGRNGDRILYKERRHAVSFLGNMA